MKTQHNFTTTTNTESIIPTKAIAILPFKCEPLQEWNDNTDIRQFLYFLYDGTGFSDVADDYYAFSQNQLEELACLFSDLASEHQPAPASITQVIDPPDFLNDIVFCRAFKYISAWEHVLGNILSEGSFFSVAHILESKTDISSSVHLAAHLYYKQAFQVLRGFIESIILPVHFCGNPNDYKKWKSNNYRSPALRGENGLLKKLETSGVLPSSLAAEADRLYSLLNRYIHGSEESFNNSGVYSKKWSGFIYQQETFRKWATVLSEVIDLGIRVIRIHHEQWEKSRVFMSRFCHICHSTDLSSTKTDSEITYTCKLCGFSSTYHEDTRIVSTSIQIINTI